jgi:carboxyl-terminal processing protease
MEEMNTQNMQKKSNITVWVLIATFVILTFGLGTITGMLIGSSAKPESSTSVNVGSLPLLKKVIKVASDHYYKPDLLTEENLAKAMLNGLDPYSTYLTPEDYRKFQEDTTGNYSGIGVMISLDETRRHVIVVQVFHPSPAASAGVQEGWIIQKIDGKDLEKVDTEHVSSLIRGPEKTDVLVTFVTDGNLIEKKITRGKIEVNTVTHKKIGDFGYIKLMQFMPQSPGEMRTALASLESQNCKGYILDLRRNGGGLLQSCQLIANHFLEPGVLVYTKDGKGTMKDLSTTGQRFKYPLVVLVDQFTASASEILTGALKDRGVATVIGMRTFGKGLVQNILPVEGYGMVKLTIESYLTPNKTEVDLFGIKPDIDFYVDPSKPVERDVNKDAMVLKAIEFLKEKMK